MIAYTEDFAVKEFIKMLQDRKMQLVNASAYFDIEFIAQTEVDYAGTR